MTPPSSLTSKNADKTKRRFVSTIYASSDENNLVVETFVVASVI